MKFMAAMNHKKRPIILKKHDNNAWVKHNGSYCLILLFVVNANYVEHEVLHFVDKYKKIIKIDVIKNINFFLLLPIIQGYEIATFSIRATVLVVNIDSGTYLLTTCVEVASLMTWWQSYNAHNTVKLKRKNYYVLSLAIFW